MTEGADGLDDGNLLVVFSMEEIVNQIKFRTQLFIMANSKRNDLGAVYLR